MMLWLLFRIFFLYPRSAASFSCWPQHRHVDDGFGGSSIHRVIWRCIPTCENF
jgi:hypothetical protein